MAERVVKVRLSAQVAEYKQGMLEAAQATMQVGSAGDKLAAQRQAMDQLGRSAIVFGASMTAGLAFAVKKFADFDQAMSAVKAATHESAENMDLLRDKALEAGARTVFSATEAANAIEELAKAGVSTADILGGALDASLDLAAAGGLGVAEAAKIAATAMTQFKLEGSEMSHVADLLAAGAGKAMGDVTDFGQALGNVGLVANQTGLTIEETTAALAIFAQNGDIGAEAGTGFRSMLMRLNPTSKEAAGMMEELGISAWDAQGNFVGLENYAGQLHSALSGLTPEARASALQIMYGSYAIKSATALYEAGADGVAQWTDAVNDSGGLLKVCLTPVRLAFG